MVEMVEISRPQNRDYSNFLPMTALYVINFRRPPNFTMLNTDIIRYPL